MNKTERWLRDPKKVRTILLHAIESYRPIDIAHRMKTSATLIRAVARHFGVFEKRRVGRRGWRECYVLYACSMKRAGISEFDCHVAGCELIPGAGEGYGNYGWASR